MFRFLARCFVAFAVIPVAAPAAEFVRDDEIVFENAHVRYVVGTNGLNRAFVDRRGNRDYLRPEASACALVRRGPREFPVTSVRRHADRIEMAFAEASFEAVLKFESAPSHLRFTVEEVRGEIIDAFHFLNVPLSLAARPSEPFAACAFSMNLHTRVDRLPVLQDHLRASGERKFGLLGARAAIVATPMPEVLTALKEVLTEAKDLPLCPVAGPWAAEIPFNHGSYLFNFGSLTETNVDEWIETTRSLAFDQIDHHGGGEFFRFGDFELNASKWPDGWATFERINARLAAAGIGSIFHTYAFFIDKRSRYVTPVPDRRLDAFRTFTLASDVPADAVELPVEESTVDLSTITGFFVHNSVLLHLGDEVVTFSGFTRERPWKFTGVRRGSLGTKATAHARGTSARHLKECFGLLVPDPESTLFEEIAARHAEIVDRCGFRGIYLDAIDGSSILRGADECWYWADKFVLEIQKRLSRPVGMEMSAMWHHFWQYRTRWQAWDLPVRGHRRFLDQHAAAVNGGLLLPLHLGWWDFQTFDPPQVEPTYAETMQTVGARLVGWNAGLSLTGGVDRNRLRSVPLLRRVVETLRECETLRRTGGFDETVRTQLREPGSDFVLETDDAGRRRFRRSRESVHLASAAEPWTLSWISSNRFGEQPLRFRLELLMSAADAGDSNAVVLADLGDHSPTEPWRSQTAAGVAARTESGTQSVPGGTATLLVATNAGRAPTTGSWAKWDRRWSAPRNLKGQQALGLWVDGDGQGECLAIRMESPPHLAHGAVADRYLPIDFRGPRFVTLVETESDRWSDLDWNDGKHLYHVYRERIDFGTVESAGVWLNRLPPGGEVRLRLGPVMALPMVPATLRHPRLTLNGHSFVLPFELKSGSWIEGSGSDTLVLYGSKGEPLGQARLASPVPTVSAGRNEWRIELPSAAGPSPRIKLTVFGLGPWL